MKLRI